MNITSRFVSIAVSYVDAPASTQGTLPATTHLAGIGLLIAQRGADGSFRFRLDSHALAAGDSEDGLLAWGCGAMPATGIVIGWQLADRIVPPLLDAGLSGDPEIGRAFIDRLSRLVTAPSIDLAVPHGGAGAPPLAEIAGRRGIPANAMTIAEIETAWAFGNRKLLSVDVEARAITTWRLWLAEGNGTAAAVSEAFERWLDG